MKEQPNTQAGLSPETLVERNVIFSGQVLRLEYDRIVLQDGAPAHREVIRHNGAVCVIPVTEDEQVYMVRQYRYPYAQMMLEIPAGKLERGEDPAPAAARELEEETGMRAERLTYMGDYFGSPAILEERIGMYLAEGLVPTAQHLDADEFLTVEKIPLATLVDAVLAGEIPDGKTQVAVLRLAELLRRRKATTEGTEECKQ